MDTLNRMHEFIGCKIRFNTHDGDYEGVVQSICPVTRKVTIEKLCYLPEQLFMGILNFFTHEIASFSLVSSPSNLEEKPQRVSRDYLTKNSSDEICDISHDLEDDDISIESDACIDDAMKENEYILRIPHKFYNRLPVDSVILDNINYEFDLAIQHIRKQDTIGVSFEGPKIGRHGNLSWLCVSTSSCTFLFDIQCLNKKGFEKGLKGIFEAQDIEKVIHDCREPSDCLYHMFDTTLVNIFDTQVADFVVKMQILKDGKITKQVSTLNCAILSYLDVPQNFLYERRTFSCYNDEAMYFNFRPIKTDVRDFVIKNVIYLRLLKQELSQLLLNPFRRGVDVYLKALQNASDQELLLELPAPDELPPALLMEGFEVFRFKEFGDVPATVSLELPDRKPKNYAKDYSSLCERNIASNERHEKKPCNLENGALNVKCNGFVSKIIAKSNESNLACSKILTCKYENDLEGNSTDSSEGKTAVNNISPHLEITSKIPSLKRNNDVTPLHHESEKNAHCNGDSFMRDERSFSPENEADVDRVIYESLGLGVENSNSLNTENIWLQLRSRSSEDFDTGDYEFKKKLKFIPAGMAKPTMQRKQMSRHS